MSNWEAFTNYMFPDGLFGATGGAVVVSVFIIGLCAFGLWKARRIFQEI